jgi:hypothetical protein
MRIFLHCLVVFLILFINTIQAQEFALSENSKVEGVNHQGTYLRINPKLITFDTKIQYEFLNAKSEFGEIVLWYNSQEKYCGIVKLSRNFDQDMMLVGFADGSMLEVPLTDQLPNIVKFHKEVLPGRDLRNQSYNFELEYAFNHKLLPTENTVYREDIRSDEYKGLWVDGTDKKMLLGNIGIDFRSIYSLFSNCPYDLPLALVEPYYLPKNQFLVESQISRQGKIVSACWLTDFSKEINTVVLQNLVIEEITNEDKTALAIDFIFGSDTKSDEEKISEISIDIVPDIKKSLPLPDSKYPELIFDVQAWYDIYQNGGKTGEIWVGLEKNGDHIIVKSPLFGDDIDFVLGRADDLILYKVKDEVENKQLCIVNEAPKVSSLRSTLLNPVNYKDSVCLKLKDESIAGFTPYIHNIDQNAEWIKFAPVTYKTQVHAWALFEKLPFFPHYLSYTKFLQDNQLLLALKTTQTESGDLEIKLNRYSEETIHINLGQGVDQWIYTVN